MSEVLIPVVLWLFLFYFVPVVVLIMARGAAWRATIATEMKLKPDAFEVQLAVAFTALMWPRMAYHKVRAAKQIVTRSQEPAKRRKIPKRKK